jgi:hypothetical protein
VGLVATAALVGVPRRRVSVAANVLVALGSIFLTGQLLATSAPPRDSVVSLWVAATVAPDGGARITEVIDWDFGPNERHGIVRDVPGLRLSAPVEASSPDAPDAVDISQGGTPRIRIGDPDRTVRGLHRYVVSYTVDGMVRDGRLAWDAVGTTWTAPIENTEIHVTAPTALDRAACTTGTEGSQAACDIRTVQPGHLVARVGELDASSGVTVSATTGAALGGTPPVPAPPVAAPSRQGLDPFLPGLLAGVITLLIAGLGSLLILRAGRESLPTVGVPLTGPPGGRERIDLAELAGYAIASPSLPTGLSPAEGGVLLDIAFHGRDRVTLGGYDRDFARMRAALGQELSAWQDRSGLWNSDADRRARRIRVVGALAGVAGALAAIVGGYLSARQAGLPVVLAGLGGALAGAGAAGGVRGWEARVFTPEGSAAWMRVESLRQFLAQSPPTAVDEVIASGHIGRYTPWAVALDEAQRWSQLASKIADDARLPYDTRGLLYAGYAPMFVTHCCTSSTASSASSGGGGVSVGGGAGGGGGSSW